MAAGGSEGIQLAQGKGRRRGAQAGRVETTKSGWECSVTLSNVTTKPRQTRGRKRVVVGLECVTGWLRSYEMTVVTSDQRAEQACVTSPPPARCLTQVLGRHFLQ